MQGNDYYIAVDLGASSGRVIVGYKKDKSIVTDEIYRFQTGTEGKDHLIWNIDLLYKEVLIGIKKAFDKYKNIKSIGVDTWGCDYVILKDNLPIYPCYAYRDSRTYNEIEKVHSLISFDNLYNETGIQFQKFNTIYQLYDDLESGRLNQADDFLMLPEYISFLLTGVKKKEYTNATTTGIVDANSKQFSTLILDKLGFPKKLFTKLYQPGTIIGKLKDEVAKYVNGNCDVVLVASHDTASAVEAIDMEENEPYISSGTWSLLGLKVKKPFTSKESRVLNYTNEGGVNYIRLQKNIMGMWLISSLKHELLKDTPIQKIVALAKKSNFNEIIDVNTDNFLAPNSMKEEFDKALLERSNKPTTSIDYFKCAYLSLARCYKQAIDELQSITNEKFTKLYIVGGGAKNDFLNQLTSTETKLKVVPLKIEASAIGNIKVQIKGENQNV